jgi:hypothetical protein
MRTSTVILCTTGLVLWSSAGGVRAHHSFAAEFDAAKSVTLTGPVTKLEWMNPHAYLYVDVKDERTGVVTNWAVELGSPNSLTRLGWRREMVKVGDVVTVEGSAAKHRANLASARSAVLTRTGEKLGAGSSQRTQ